MWKLGKVLNLHFALLHFGRIGQYLILSFLNLSVPGISIFVCIQDNSPSHSKLQTADVKTSFCRHHSGETARVVESSIPIIAYFVLRSFTLLQYSVTVLLSMYFFVFGGQLSLAQLLM